MFDLDKYEEIWQSITRNKVRSLLTCFGVFWGILMLVILLGAGNGLKNGVYKNVQGFAVNSLFFYTNQTAEPYKGFKQGRWWSMKYRDVDVIKERVKGLEYISPMLWSKSSDNNVVRGEKAGTFSARGCYPEYFKIEQQRILYGRLLNEMDMKEKRKVCVIGKRVMETLFRPGENPIGTYIKVNGIYFQIVGVIDPIPRASIGGDTKESVILPASTMRQAFNMGDNIYFLCVTIKKGFSGDEMLNEITALLKSQNQIAPNDPQAVGSFSIERQAKAFDTLFIGISVLIWLVGIGTLLSGIIGVSNILLVTVKERTKEIGVRRAIGAKPFSIISQIVSESLTITFFAGIMGLALGIWLLDIVNKALSGAPDDDGNFFMNPEISLHAALAATFILLLSGFIAGIIPAWRAMQIKAIDAIREE